MTKPLIIGIGNRFRGDDAVGLIIADKLRGKIDADVIEHDGDATSLIDALNNRNNVLIIDAIFSNKKVGEILKYDLNKTTLPDIFAKTSSHAMGVSEAIELARMISILPKETIFYGIEGKNFEIEQEMSEEVLASVDELLKIIVIDIMAEVDDA